MANFTTSAASSNTAANNSIFTTTTSATNTAATTNAINWGGDQLPINTNTTGIWIEPGQTITIGGGGWGGTGDTGNWYPSCTTNRWGAN